MGTVSYVLLILACLCWFGAAFFRSALRSSFPKIDLGWAGMFLFGLGLVLRWTPF